MKFITEDDLRDLYKKEPFTDYQIEPGTRITPGARQFLADRGINMFDDGSRKKSGAEKSKDTSQKAESSDVGCGKKLCSRIMSAEVLFLETVEVLLGRDILLAQKVIHLKKSFSEIKNALNEGCLPDQLICEKCTGISEDRFSDDLDDCFEITEFHIQLAKGKEIITLHKLRCSLREFQLDLPEFFGNSDEETKLYEKVAGKVNQIINTLSQLICLTAGGEKCQRKI